MNKKTFHLISLGCAKNTVDSQSMAELLHQGGYVSVEKQKMAAILIVNTCGFIQPAREESIKVLNELACWKKPGQLLIAAGCLTERHRQTLLENVEGIDGFIGTRNWMDILEVVEKVQEKRSKQASYSHIPNGNNVSTSDKGIPRVAVQGASAYLKIADGCRRPCAFCSIPLIKGTTVSRPPERILDDALRLQKMGIQEINLIAQDTTDYGYDLGIKDGLATLLEQLVNLTPDIPWIRIQYTFPGYITDRLISVMAQNRQILHYLDMPLQHAHPETLRRMNRPQNLDWIHKTLQKIRRDIPDIALRTTFILGYPGETESEFQTLLDFVSEIRFDHLGAFTYSAETGTPSEPLGDPIPLEVKQQRLELLMNLQEKISMVHNQQMIGKTLDILVEGSNDGIAVGRSYRDAPEIDGLVFLDEEMPPGEIIPVFITGAMTHDLLGHYRNDPVKL